MFELFISKSRKQQHYTPIPTRICLIQEPAIIERRRGWPIGSITSSIIANRVDRFTRREPLAFEGNTGYAFTNRGRGRGDSL